MSGREPSAVRVKATSLLLLLALGLAGLPANAQPADPGKEACMAAHTENQRKRKDGELLDARTLLRTCADPSCPGLVVKDCTEWLEQLDKEIPTIVVAAKGPDQSDLSDVEIEIDGQPVTSDVAGAPISIDPGEHEVVVRAKGDSASKSIVARAGEKNRVVELVVGSSTSKESPSGTVSNGEKDDDGPSGLLISGLVIGGAGLVVTGIFIPVGLGGASDADELQMRCGDDAPAPNTNTCTEQEIDDVRSTLIVADVLLGVGAALTLTGVALVVVDQMDDSSEKVAASVAVGATPTPGGASGFLRVTF